MKIMLYCKNCKQGEAKERLGHDVTTECVGRVPQLNGGEVTIETCRADGRVVVIIAGTDKDDVYTETVVIP